MIVVTEDGAVRLEEAENLKGFKLLAGQARGDLPAIAAALAGVGRVEGEAAWIAEAWLLDQAGARDAEWTADFARMIDFARSRGWYDDATRSIRAHIEWAG